MANEELLPFQDQYPGAYEEVFRSSPLPAWILIRYLQGDLPEEASAALTRYLEVDGCSREALAELQAVLLEQERLDERLEPRARALLKRVATDAKARGSAVGDALGKEAGTPTVTRDGELLDALRIVALLPGVSYRIRPLREAGLYRVVFGTSEVSIRVEASDIVGRRRTDPLRQAAASSDVAPDENAYKTERSGSGELSVVLRPAVLRADGSTVPALLEIRIGE